MAFRGAVPDADGCECTAAPARPAGGVQRAALACAGRCAVAAAAARPAALADGVPAVPALGRGGLLRGDGQRHALGLRVSDGRRGSRVHMAVDTLGQLIAIRAGARAGQGAVRGGAGGRRRDGQAGVGGSGLHRRAGQAGRPGQRDRSADRQTARGEEGLCPAATTLGGRAQFRLAVALSSAQP